MMELMLIRRRDRSGADGTLGIMQAGTLMFYTMERPWLDNAVGQSCVPAGRYQLVPHISPKFGQVRALVNHDLGVAENPTPGIPRALVLIHAANLSSELQGCIAPGRSIGTLTKNGKDYPAVLESKAALADLYAALGPTDEHWLTISWDASGPKDSQVPDFSNVESGVETTAEVPDPE